MIGHRMQTAIKIGKQVTRKYFPDRRMLDMWEDNSWYTRFERLHRKTRVCCSKINHGCGHLREAFGPNMQEIRELERTKVDEERIGV